MQVHIRQQRIFWGKYTSVLMLQLAIHDPVTLRWILAYCISRGRNTILFPKKHMSQHLRSIFVSSTGSTTTVSESHTRRRVMLCETSTYERRPLHTHAFGHKVFATSSISSCLSNLSAALVATLLSPVDSLQFIAII